jgi:hypothetical protein
VGSSVIISSRRWSVFGPNLFYFLMLDLRLSIGFLETCAAQMGTVHRCFLVPPLFVPAVGVIGDRRVIVTCQGRLLFDQRVEVSLRRFSPCKGGGRALGG